ncbi:MAG: carboxypeptidase regulatory-like domain-containing protein, partial [Acidobacteriota bacterium]
MVRVDGVSSAGYPITILPGTFTPGTNTISGQITDAGTPVANAAVALIVNGTCYHDRVSFWTASATDSSGYYTLDWPGTGSNYTVFVLPPRSAGLAATAAPVSASGDITQDFALTAGTTVTGTIEDPSNAGLQNAVVSFDGPGHDQVLTDASGNFTLHLAPASWDLSVDPPIGAHARNIQQVSVTVPASSPYSLGTQALQGGIWVSGALEDDSPTPQPVVAADVTAGPPNGGSDFDEVLSRPDGTFGV